MNLGKVAVLMGGRSAEREMFAHPGLRAVVCNSAMVRGEIERRRSHAHAACARDGIDPMMPSSHDPGTALALPIEIGRDRTVVMFVEIAAQDFDVCRKRSDETTDDVDDRLGAMVFVLPIQMNVRDAQARAGNPGLDAHGIAVISRDSVHPIGLDAADSKTTQDGKPLWPLAWIRHHVIRRILRQEIARFFLQVRRERLTRRSFDRHFLQGDEVSPKRPQLIYDGVKAPLPIIS